jgi:hypothetical protein
MAGFQDETLDRFEDVDWFFSLALHGFTLEVLPIVAVAIERSRRNDPAKIEAAAASLLRKWQGQPPTLLRCLQSYMDLEIAAANYFAGSKVKAFRRLLSSFAKVPRLSLQLSPGWIKKTGTAVNLIALSNSLLETHSSETVSENNSSVLLDNVYLTTKLPKLPRSL